MYRLFEKLPVLFLALLGWASVAFDARATQNPFIVIDANSGAIIAEHKANDQWHPASLTKLMTAYVTFRAIAQGEIEDGSPVVITQAATKQPPSRMGYKKGVNLRVDTALKIIIIKSANDVSLALAQAVAGSLRDFVLRMNIEATMLGMTNTNFANSNGLHNAKQVS
ncbi:MAG: serine hydrolase, partial [Pseudomonadota bacterium]